MPLSPYIINTLHFLLYCRQFLHSNCPATYNTFTQGSLVLKLALNTTRGPHTECANTMSLYSSMCFPPPQLHQTRCKPEYAIHSGNPTRINPSDDIQLTPLRLPGNPETQRGSIKYTINKTPRNVSAGMHN